MGSTTKNTDEKQQAYKKAKKQQRKLRKAGQLKNGTSKDNNAVTDKNQTPPVGTY